MGAIAREKSESQSNHLRRGDLLPIFTGVEVDDPTSNFVDGVMSQQL